MNEGLLQLGLLSNVVMEVTQAFQLQVQDMVHHQTIEPEVIRQLLKEFTSRWRTSRHGDSGKRGDASVGKINMRCMENIHVITKRWCTPWSCGSKHLWRKTNQVLEGWKLGVRCLPNSPGPTPDFTSRCLSRQVITVRLQNPMHRELHRAPDTDGPAPAMTGRPRQQQVAIPQAAKRPPQRESWPGAAPTDG